MNWKQFKRGEVADCATGLLNKLKRTYFNIFCFSLIISVENVFPSSSTLQSHFYCNFCTFYFFLSFFAELLQRRLGTSSHKIRSELNSIRFLQ